VSIEPAPEQLQGLTASDDAEVHRHRAAALADSRLIACRQVSV
jgi:hypothetical protein